MVPVLDKDKKKLMPCSEKRARKLLEKREAKPYWSRGVFCIILQKEPSSRNYQDIAIGIDPGSKFEGFSVKSESHTLINIQTEAKTDVKDKVEARKNLRRSRRNRKTRYRQCRFNRSVGNRIPPSTKSRWVYKLSIINWIRKLYNITHVVVENVKAKTWKNAKKWNMNFSPIEVGKEFFRNEIKKLGVSYTEFNGYETFEFRNSYGFKKNSKKSKKDFYTHCVDAWVLANQIVGGHTEVDNLRTLYLKPLKIFRRQLHVQNFSKGGVRKTYGSTRSMGLERRTLVKHHKHGLTLVGGTSKNRISLNSMSDNKRLCQNAKKEDLKILTNQKWNIKT